MTEAAIWATFYIVVGCLTLGVLAWASWYTERAHHKFRDGLAGWLRSGGQEWRP